MTDSKPIDDNDTITIFKKAIEVLHTVETDEELIAVMHSTVKAIGDNLAITALITQQGHVELRHLIILDAYFTALKERKSDDATLIAYSVAEHLEYRGKLLVKLHEKYRKKAKAEKV